MAQEKYIPIITVLSIIAVALSISLPVAFSSGPCSPDGQRYVFNGILLHDMIRDGEFLNPYQYNVKFYARYPATNLPYGPPVFALVFAVAFSIFGISFAVARCIVAVYTVGAALMCWYLVYKITTQYWSSILAVAAFLSNPIIGDRARDIGPELAVAFHCFLAIYFFYHYVEDEKKYFAVYSALALGLGYLTKPYIIPLGIALSLYVLVRGKWYIFARAETWFALFIVFILTVPYTILSFRFSIEELGLITLPPITWDLLMGYLKLIVLWIPILTFLAMIGFVVGIYQKNRLTWLCLLWVGCWYGFFTFYIGYYINKWYLLSFVLAILIPFALACHKITVLMKRVQLDKVFIGFLFVWCVYNALSIPVFYIRGYEDAGKYIAENPRGKSVLFYGTYDGSFMMGVRKHIHRGGPYILRGERQLAVRRWFDDSPQKLLVKSSDDVIQLFNNYQTGYVVIEKDMPTAEEYPEYKILIQTLKKTNFFHEVASFAIQTNCSSLGPELIVYAFNLSDEADKAKTLKIPVPTLGGNLNVSY